jgi:protein-tyrosine-phosphatase
MHVLVVCTANIARSPLFAAMLAARLGAAVEVASAGTRARDGYPAAEFARTLAEQRGLDLSSHRSQPITSELVAGAGLVLTMSERQRDACASLVGRSADRVYTVKEFVRLLDAVDASQAPSDPVARLAWSRDQAHLARPRAAPAKGAEDVADPIRSPWPDWEAMGRTFDELVARIAEG